MSNTSPTMPVTFRRAQTLDFAGLVTLQNANLVGNLSDDARADGFLSVGFSADQFSKMNDDLCVIVGTKENLVKAFLCASTVEFNKPFALPKTMIDRFPQALFDNKPLTDWQVCICGPVCVDASLRGQGAFEKLYQCFYNIVPETYELATVFVSTDNPRSIKAHEKIGMKIIDHFDFNARAHVIMTGRITKN